MSGHSKWANIKRKKEANDAVKGKIFTKIGREISVVVKQGGPDPANNAKLANLIAKAKSNNIPNDNIDRIIKKAAGDGDKNNYEEIVYEGYGPGGVAVIVECLTDNKNLTAANIKNISAVSPGILQLKYESGETAYFQADANGAQLVDIGDFDGSRITFAPQAADESSGSDAKSTYIMQLDGAPIYDTVWTSAKPADKSEIKTSRKFEAVYKAVSAAGTYYITFDKYYNFCVYEAAYGFVSLKIGGGFLIVSL